MKIAQTDALQDLAGAGSEAPSTLIDECTGELSSHGAPLDARPSSRWYIFAILAMGAGCMVTVALVMYQQVQKAQWVAGSIALRH